MFGTIIIDAYRKDEAIKIWEAVDNLCSPTDNYGWASAGVYCFWNYYTKQVYYIGLAVDLATRFKQHNGIISIKDAGCKKAFIDEYFKKNDKLGYSILAQSPLSQPITSRNKKIYDNFDIEGFPIEDYVGSEGKDNIKKAEGILIEAYNKVKGEIPKWNKIGGSIAGQEASKVQSYSLVEDFTHSKPSPFIAKVTLRELMNEPKYAWYENCLHGVRMMMLSMGCSFLEAFETQRRFQMKSFGIDTYGDIIKENYLNKELQF